MNSVKSALMAVYTTLFLQTRLGSVVVAVNPYKPVRLGLNQLDPLQVVVQGVIQRLAETSMSQVIVLR